MSIWHSMLSRIKRGIKDPETITQLVTEAKDKIKNIGEDGETILAELLEINWSCRDFNRPTKKDIDHDVELSRNELRGKRKSQTIDNIREKQAERESDPKKIFRSLGQKRENINMKKVRVGDKIYSDPYTCQDKLTETFRKWFANEEPLEKNLINKIRTFEDFRARTNQTVPEELAEGLYTAIMEKNLPEDYLEEIETVDKFTMQDFENTLSTCSNESAGGPSGLTYLMLKHLPAELFFFFEYHGFLKLLKVIIKKT